MSSTEGSRSPRNFAARAGRWSARHRRIAIVGWLVFVIAAFLVGGAVGTNEMTEVDQYSGEAARAEQAMVDGGFQEPASESVLIQTERGSAQDPAFRAAVADVADRVSAVSGVENVQSPLARGGEALVSEDGRSALVRFDLAGDPDTADQRVDPVLGAVDAAAKAHPDLLIAQFGDASAAKALEESLGDDFQRAEMLSLPITLAILLLAFGAFVAAGIPVLLAISAVFATLGLVAIPSQIFPVDDAIASIILLIGLAVGVDYSLFYIRREREERAAGRSPRRALEVAAATSGRAVLISGLTVIVAMAGMFLTGNKTFTSFGVGTILVVAVAVLGSLTVLPALLAALGDRVDKGRLPFIGRRRGGNSRVWGAIIDRVMRRPVVSALASAAILVALAVPALGMKTQLPGLEDLPADLAVVQTYEKIQAAFPGEQMPAVVVVQADDVRGGDAGAAITELRERALASGQVREPITIEANEAGTTALVTMPLVGNGTDATSNHALDVLREELIPATVGRAGAEASVTGMTAADRDFNDLMDGRTPLVFAFVLGLAFLLLLVTFRSVVIPVKAIVLNLLSVGAAYGVLTLVFQEGWGENLLGFESTGAITSWLPLFLFVILFGLSMDYHVFILSRVREAFDRGMSTSDAVSHGIRSTAAVVTSAAAVMVAVFAVFATLSTIDMKQMGVGLAVAILLDATLIRAVLLPATMKLLGDWNWYLPRWLEWLPRLDHGESADAAPRAEENVDHGGEGVAGRLPEPARA